jgi:glycosyltransferase involved in cell wall biosynthesis
MRDTLCNIVPLRAGGGTRLKILNSWAMGKAIVSTSVGCEGLDARDGENMLIRDDPREFAEAILTLRGDESLRLKLEQGARKTAEELYSWDVIGPAMVASYRGLLPD